MNVDYKKRNMFLKVRFYCEFKLLHENFLEIINLHQEITKNFSGLETFTELDSSYNLFFSIGGDGTILKSVTFVGDL